MPLAIEKAETYEAEIGHDWSSTLSSSLNIFKTTVLNPIIYSNDSSILSYINFPGTGTEGFEFEVQDKSPNLFSYLGFSYYEGIDNQVSLYNSGKGSELLGIPQTKLVLLETYKLSQTQSLTAVLVWNSSYHGYDYDPTQTAPATTLVSAPENTLLNLHFRQQDFLCKHCEADLGVANVLNQTVKFYQPFNSNNNSISSGNPPIPGYGRDIYARFGYSVNF